MTMTWDGAIFWIHCINNSLIDHMFISRSLLCNVIQYCGKACWYDARAVM